MAIIQLVGAHSIQRLHAGSEQWPVCRVLTMIECDAVAVRRLNVSALSLISCRNQYLPPISAAAKKVAVLAKHACFD